MSELASRRGALALGGAMTGRDLQGAGDAGALRGFDVDRLVADEPGCFEIEREIAKPLATACRDWACAPDDPDEQTQPWPSG